MGWLPGKACSHTADYFSMTHEKEQAVPVQIDPSATQQPDQFIF